MAADRSSIMLRGVLDLCVLALVADRAVYGYEIVGLLAERGLEVSGGSVYPLLARLEKSGDVRAEYRPSSDGPPRRYWTLTAAGRATLSGGRHTWTTVARAVDGLLAEHTPITTGRCE